MLLQVPLRSLTESSSPAARVALPSPGSVCSSGYLGDCIVLSRPWCPAFPIKEQGILESPRASLTLSSVVPWLQEERLSH